MLILQETLSFSSHERGAHKKAGGPKRLPLTHCSIIHKVGPTKHCTHVAQKRGLNGQEESFRGAEDHHKLNRFTSRQITLYDSIR